MHIIWNNQTRLTDYSELVIHFWCLSSYEQTIRCDKYQTSRSRCPLPSWAQLLRIKKAQIAANDWYLLIFIDIYWAYIEIYIYIYYNILYIYIHTYIYTYTTGMCFTLRCLPNQTWNPMISEWSVIAREFGSWRSHRKDLLWGCYVVALGVIKLQKFR